ncbi:hypothetical protein XENOCAPTIV_007379, partial [Xenoophorus captivus]
SESLCDWGETLCAACPNMTTIITAGSSTVVCVWEVAVSKDKLTHIKLRQIASCAGPLLYLWTMKGQLLACTGTSSGPQADILCVSFTQRHEWDSRNVIVTGWSASGQGKAWRRCLMLCQELSSGQSVSQRRSNDSPAITALAMSRYRNQHAPASSNGNNCV